MTVDVNPPNDDKETTRHKFYVAVTSALDNNTNAMLSIGKKLDILVDEHNTVADEFKDLQISIRNTLRIAAFLATILGASTAVMLSKTWQYTERLEKLEQYVQIHEVQTKPYEKMPEKIEALNRKVQSLEDEVYYRKGERK